MGVNVKKGNGKFWLLLTILGLVVINWLASLLHTRIDFTNEKRFTLSAPTKKILRQLDDVVQVDIFLKGAFPSGFKNLANRTGEMLQEFKEIAGNKIQFNYISPDDAVEGTNIPWADTLAAVGLYPINLKSQLKAGEQQQLVFPVALVHYKEGVLPVNLYSGSKTFITPAELNSAEALMEFKFADAISKLTQPSKPMIAYSVGNGEPTGFNTYDLVENTLRRDYNLFTFNLNTQPLIPDTFQLLIIVKPTQPFSEEAKLKIDQFVIRGGRLLLYIDKLNAEMDSLQTSSGQLVAYDRALELNDLLFRYGARVNPDLVMDLQCDYLPNIVNGKDQVEYFHWNYFPLFESKSNHPINRNLGLVAGQFVNSIDTTEAAGIRKTVLLSSSANSRSISTPAVISFNENKDAVQDEKFNKADIPVAVLLEGKFQSLYSNRLSTAMRDSLGAYGATFIQESLYENKIIVVADGDMVLNAAKSATELLPMGLNRYTIGSQYEYQFANKDFLLNSIDYLINPSGLAELKAKDYTLRLLDPKKLNDQKTMWQVINLLVPVLLLLIFALVYQWVRKRKYVK